MNHQRWIKPLLITLLLCCAAPLSVADDEPAAPPQEQKATEHETAKPFTIAVLPDTQYYCDTRLKLSAKWGNGDLQRYFFAQTRWVRDNQEQLNIAFLVHEGDIVQADAPDEWAIARKAMSVLDGKVPYCMCLGNHDMGFEKADNKYGGNIGVNRTTHFNTYFPRDKFAKRREFGGTFDPDRHDNSWYHFETAGLKFLIVALEYHPRDEVLDWANRIVAEHPDHRVIVLTHSYLKGNKTRTTNKLKLKGNNGEQMWQKFVSKHKNMFMVLCGHFSGEAVLTSTGDHGNQVHQILSDYQEMNNGGESWLRYMVFQPEANKIGIYTYSPALDKFRNGPSSRFDLDYPMAQPPVTAPGITRPGAASDVNKEAKQDGADQPATAPESPAAESAGLIVKDGILHRDGEPYRGVGANYFNLFSRVLKDGSDTSYDEELRKLSAAQIPFVRFMAGGFWPVYWDLYLRDKEEYFKRMDAVVRAAEKHQVGLIPSLFWNMATFPDLVGEPMDQLGNEESKTIAFIEQYTTEMVLRYRSSSAIWGWEFGNEYNLHVDLPNASSHRPKIVPHLKTGLERTSRDELSSDAMLTAFGHFARTVRKHDAHRILITGNSIPRRSAFHNTKERSHKPDNRAQFESILIRDNPSPYDVTCVHLYGNDGQGGTKSISELVETLQEIAGRTRQPLFIGEFGAPKTLGPEDEKALFIEMLKAIEENNVPLSAFWVFDHPGQVKDWNVSFENERAYMLKLVADLNQRMKSSGRTHKAEAHQPATEPESKAAESAQYLGAANGFKKETIKALADRVRGHVNSQPLRFPNQHWVRGAYYAGLMAMYESTSDRAYLDDCMKWGKQVSWRIKEQGGGPYESGAYPLICGQIWYGCYRAKKDELMMQPTLAFLEDPKVENPVSAPGKWYLENTGHRFVDGLFTAPPVLAMLYQMTGDEKYVDWMNACFWDVHKEIFDHDAGLFYRDARSKPRKTKNGKKVLWSRGNGWAFGGLTRILKHLPEHHASYARYKALYIQMAESLAKRQQADGFWRSNLDDPEQYPMKESSGTGFFCYGITWGINNGILNRERFLPVARKAWTALTSVVNEDGKVGWSQPAGGGPGKVAEADTSKFGTGIFLLAASEVFLLMQSPAASKPLGLRPGPNATVLLNGDVVHADVCVYGGTPSGIAAAISAAREGASVVLLEQTRHVGGLSASGLNRDEGEHMDRATMGGLCQYFTAEAARRSGSNTEAIKRGARKWQSKHAEQVFLDMLKDAGVPVLYEQLLEKVEKNGTRITKVRVRNGTTYHAKVFLDATYEGDLMAAAGVSYAVGREARDTYDEEKAGVRYMDEKVKVSPYDEDGNLLFGVMPGPAPEEFRASVHPICYNVRLNLTTDKANMVSIGKPANYDPKQHELLARCIEAGYIKRLGAIIGLYPMPGSQKRELNNRQFSYVSMSIPGAQTAWSEASFEEREKIHQQYRDYTHGMLWFLKSDPRVPESIRQDMGQYGFCKDEWTDNQHWPWYLYIRAARRMKGRYVLTQHDVTETSDKDDVIHIGSHFIDSHQVTRYAIDKDHFINEGRMWQKGMRFDIPYRAITPKAEECENLLVPVCVSASNVAFAAIRLEPTWMHLGEAAGIAAVMAGKNSVQSVNVTKLQARIRERGIPLEIPEGQAMTDAKPAKKGDVVAQLFAAADLDLNGTVSKTEWSIVRADWAWLFPVMDKNADGQLDRAEYKAWQIYKKEHPDWHKVLRCQEPITGFGS